MDTCNEMSNSLRIKLAKRKDTSTRSLSINAKINATNLDSPTQHTTNNLDDLRAVKVYLNVVKITEKGSFNTKPKGYAPEDKMRR